MNMVTIRERSCEHYRQHFDAYLDNELAAEDRHVVLLHVCACSDCAGILDVRSKVKQLLRNAVGREESPVELVKALQIRFRPKQQGFFAYNTSGWMVVAAAVLIRATGVVASLSFRL